jgi:hypothetical protein
MCFRIKELRLGRKIMNVRDDFYGFEVVDLKNSKWLLLLWAAIFLVPLPEAAAKGYQTRIYPSVSGFTKGYLKLAPDGKRVGFAYFKNGKHFVQINNKLYGGFAIGETVSPFIKYSPDGKIFTFIYWQEGRFYLQLNDRIYGGYTEVELPLFGATGKLAGFRYAKNNRWYLWINGQKYGGYQAVEMPLFTADETGVGFAYRKWLKWYININNKKYGGFRRIWGPVLSGDGNHFGLVGQKGHYDQVYYIDGKSYGPVDRVWRFGSSLDGQSFNVYYEREGISYARTGPNRETVLGELVFPREDPKKVDISGGLVYQGQDEKYLQYGDVILGGYREIGTVVFGTRRNLWGFSYRQKDGYYIRVGERDYGPYPEGAYGPYFSPNEKAFAYWYRAKERVFVNVNNWVYHEGVAKDFALLQLVSSVNGRVTGYRFRKNGQEYVRVGQMVYGGRGTIHSGTLMMSNNGACFAYRFRYNDQEYVQMNEKVFQCGDYQWADFVITPENKACFAQIKNGKIVIQEIDYN